MKINKTIVAVSTALALGSSVALAAPATNPLAGPYLGAGLGFGAIVKTDFAKYISSIPQVNVDTFGFAWNVKSGWLFDVGVPNFAVGPEIGYTGYPPTRINAPGASEEKLEAGSLDILGVARYAFGDFNVAGKVGMGVLFSTVGADQDGNGGQNYTNLVPEVGVGLGYNLANLTGLQGLFVNADFQYLFGNNQDLSDGNNTYKPFTWAVLFGFTYNFAGLIG